MTVDLIKKPSYLGLNNVGVLEIVFAVTPLLSGYGLGSLPMSLLMWSILIAMVVVRGRRMRVIWFKPLLFFVLYWLIHQVFIMLVDNVNLNGVIEQLIYFAAIFILYPVLDIQKLRGSLNWVAIVAIIGLLYQWKDILGGGFVHPLEIPGLSMPESRMDELSLRPSSFFMEPAAFVSYMICPLFFSLFDRKYIWSTVLILSMFLTTSTTGIIVSFLMLGIGVLNTRKVNLTTIMMVAVIIGGLMYALLNLDMFQVGIEKIENTDVSTNVRLSQGQYIVSTMNPSEYIFGVPYSTAYNYCKAGRATDVIFYGESVYMSTFWQMLLLYGVVGLILYLNVYVRVLKRSRNTLTLIAALVAVIFSGSIAIGPTYVFTMIILLMIVREEQSLLLKKN